MDQHFAEMSFMLVVFPLICHHVYVELLLGTNCNVSVAHQKGSTKYQRLGSNAWSDL